MKLNIEGHVVGPLQNNTFLVSDPVTRDAAVVDPGLDSGFLMDRIRDEGLALRYVLNTHGHFDHIALNGRFLKAFDAKLLIHQGDAPMIAGLTEHARLFGFQAEPSPEPDGFLEDGQAIRIGEGNLKVLHTPGHSLGGVCFLGEGWVIAGDTLFAQSIGRTDLPGGSLPVLLRSIRERLLTLPPETKVYTGHGPSTTVGYEKDNNPFLELDERTLRGMGGGDAW